MSATRVFPRITNMFSSLAAWDGPLKFAVPVTTRRVVAEGIHENEFIVDVVVAVKSGQDLAEEMLEVAFLELGADRNDRVPGARDVSLDNGVDRLVEQQVAQRIAGQVKRRLENRIEIERERHAYDALRGRHPIGVPMQRRQGDLVVAGAV